MIEVADGGASLLPWGDTINHRAQLRQPGLVTGPDDDVQVALRARRRLLGELVDSGRVLAPPPFAEPFGRLVSEGPAAASAGCRRREASAAVVTFPGRVLSIGVRDHACLDVIAP